MGRRGRSGGRVIDTIHWEGFAGGSLALAAGTSAINLISSSTLPFTIMRTRGNLIGFVDSASTPGSLAEIGVGFILVPEGTSTTVLWSPITDPNAPWFYYTRFVIGQEELVTDVIEVATLTGYREVIDSKAMRRVAPDTEVQVVFENATIGGAEDANVFVSGRILFGE